MEGDAPVLPEGSLDLGVGREVVPTKDLSADTAKLARLSV